MRTRVSARTGDAVGADRFTARGDQRQVRQAHVVHGTCDASDVAGVAGADQDDSNSLKHVRLYGDVQGRGVDMGARGSVQMMALRLRE